MKTTIFYSIISLLFVSDLFAEPTLREEVKKQMEVFEQTKNRPMPVGYPELAQRLEEMFLRHPVTHIVITGSSEGQSGATDIYIKAEEIYVINAAERWNLVANRNGVFEWQKDQKGGIKVKRNNEDLVAYLYYLTDPSWIMASIYYDYREAPDQFTLLPDKNKSWTQLEFKKPVDGFEAIYVSEKPLWFCGMRVQNPQTGVRQEVFFSKPEETKGPPESFLQEFKKITFENSNLTLRRHMAFL
jgi:hypothetical protein